MQLEPKEIWRDALSHIQLSISRTHFKAWFSSSSIVSIEDKTITIGAKNKIARAYFEDEFYEVIKSALTTVIKKEPIIKFTVVTAVEKKTVTETSNQADLFDSVVQDSAAAIQNEYMQATQLLGINPKYQFDNFIVGSSNRLAHAAAYAVAQNPGYAYNPLFIYGDVGLGKTHLIQAISNYLLKQDPHYKIVYCSSEVFLNEMVSAIKSQNVEPFRRKYREKQMLIIDDIQFIESKKGTQEEVFHTFNSMYQFNKQIIIVSDRPPEDMPYLEARLRSRFEGGMVVDINKPEYETRLAIIQQKCEEKGYILPEEILHFVAQRFESNIREIEGALTKIGSLTTIGGKEHITLKDAIHLFGGKTNKKNVRIKPNDIINAVCDTYNISLKEIKSAVRTERIAYSRQVAMYLLRTELHMPFIEVAQALNRKDHTTVMHAVTKIENLQESNEETKEEIEELLQMLKG